MSDHVFTLFAAHLCKASLVVEWVCTESCLLLVSCWPIQSLLSLCLQETTSKGFHFLQLLLCAVPLRKSWQAASCTLLSHIHSYTIMCLPPHPVLISYRVILTWFGVYEWPIFGYLYSSHLHDIRCNIAGWLLFTPDITRARSRVGFGLE